MATQKAGYEKRIAELTAERDELRQFQQATWKNLSDTLAIIRLANAPAEAWGTIQASLRMLWERLPILQEALKEEREALRQTQEALAPMRDQCCRHVRETAKNWEMTEAEVMEWEGEILVHLQADPRKVLKGIGPQEAQTALLEEWTIRAKSYAAGATIQYFGSEVANVILRCAGELRKVAGIGPQEG